MATSALASIGVMPPSRTFPWCSDQDEVLAIANEYRLAIVDLYQERHCRTIDLRDRLFPRLFAAMVTYEAIGADIHRLETIIKQHHSEVRDRNAVTVAQEAELLQLRELRKASKSQIVTEKKTYLAMFADFRSWWKSAAPDAVVGWKNVKTLEQRRQMYAELKLPAGASGEFAALHIELDLRERELDREFAPKLHPAIRAEIKEASRPKLKPEMPGIFYRYGRLPEVREWQKLTVQFVGGLTWEKALRGTSQLTVQRLYTNHCAGGDETAYLVRQQIGTAQCPRHVTYVIKDPALTRLELTSTIQSWSLIVRGKKRVVVPILKDLPAKPVGSGVATYKLRWTVRKDGVEVAHIWGEHVNERVLIPRWIVDRVLRVKDEQAIVDLRCNELLARRGVAPETGKKQGMEAMMAYSQEFPLDNAAANLLDDCQRTMHLMRKDAESARRAIEDIYNVVASKVLRLHSHMVHDDLDLSKIKRYDTRDLLQADVLPAKSREILHAVSPGKLRLRLQQGRLPASAEVPKEPPVDARTTDHWTSYVLSLGQKTGRKPPGNRYCS